MRYLTYGLCFLLLLFGNASAQTIPDIRQFFPKRTIPTINIPEGTVGDPHKVTGQVIQTTECVLPLTSSTISLDVYYFLPDASNNWTFPQRTPTEENFFAGYDKLFVAGESIELRQGRSIATTKPDSSGKFVLSWKEVVKSDLTPYIKARRFIKSNFDPNDTFGFKEIFVKRVYVLEGSQSDSENNWVIDFVPVIWLEFFGTETEKSLPPLIARCVITFG